MNIKILTLTALSFIFCFAACNKDKSKDEATATTEDTSTPVLGDVNFVFDYKSILMEFTSTGCPGCGSWGKPTFYSLTDNNVDDVVPIAAHIKYGDPMISGVAEFFASNRTGSRYTPQIWVNDKTIMVISGNSISGAASITNANNLIMNAIPTKDVGLGSVMVIQDGKAYSKYGVKLNADFAAGDYWINSYLLEDGIVEQQLGYRSNPATHNYVLRQAANGPWGNMITKKSGEVFEASWVHTYTEDIKEGQYLVNVLWKKTGGIYRPVNAVKVK